MKALLIALVFVSSLARAEEPAAYFSLFDNKVYSLKTKGVKDFVVDLSSSKLTGHINDQKTFGAVKKLIFRAYWTANPERLDIEVMGLPEGFHEVKAQLIASILPLMDSVLPMTIQQRFPGYKFTAGPKPKTFIATDTTGVAPVPSYVLNFDEQDKLATVIANRAIGTSETKFDYEKKGFTDGKWAFMKSTSTTSESGQTITSERELEYGTSQGIGVVTSVTLTTTQKFEKGDMKPVTQSDEIAFENYKINTGEGLKHFLSETQKNTPVTEP